jgi:excisionase family DNA binding protein
LDKAESGSVNGISCLLTAKNVAKILNCSLPTVFNLAERGQLKCVRWPCQGKGTKRRDAVRFKKEDILEFIESHSKN